MPRRVPYNNVYNPVNPRGKRTSLIIDPPDGRLPAYTPEAQKRVTAIREYVEALMQGSSGGPPELLGKLSPRKNDPPPFYNTVRTNRADNPEDRSDLERCLGTLFPTFTGRDFIYRIVQSPGQVAIYYQARYGGGSRVIPVNGSAHLPARIRLYWGDPRGRWEGQSLVVDTTNFTSRTDFYGSRENLHIVERLTRTGPKTLEDRITFDDPTTWVRPWTVVLDLTQQDNKENRIFESACNEGNYGLVGMLANTRAAEKAFAAGKGPDPALQDLASAASGE
jgi:hypothetical protein